MFAKVDLGSGYDQLRINQEYILKMSFRTRYGGYKCTVMPFGLINSPTIFIDLMNRVFRLYLEFVAVFMDNIMIHSKDKEEHVNCLSNASQNLRKHQLYAKLKRYEFLLTELAFLGMWFPKKGLKLILRR